MTTRERKNTECRRDLYGYMIDTVRFVTENSSLTDPVDIQKSLTEFVRHYRRKIRALDTASDPIDRPLTRELRRLADDEGGYTEYGILEEDGFTSDEDIRDYIREYIEIPEWSSPYDCTGRPFTMYVNWKRTPAGIAIVHRVCLDL